MPVSIGISHLISYLFCPQTNSEGSDAASAASVPMQALS